jgi:hypothetical protein
VALHAEIERLRVAIRPGGRGAMKDRRVEAVYPLSPAQEGILFATLFGGRSKVCLSVAGVSAT